MRLALRLTLAVLAIAPLSAQTAFAQNDVFGQILQGFAQGMQQSQRNQGGYNRNQWGQNNNNYRPSGNWFNTTPNYRYENRPRYGWVGGAEVTTDSSGRVVDSDSFGKRVITGYDRVRVRDGSTVTPNVGNIIGDVAGAIGAAAQNSNQGYDNRDRYRRYDNRGYDNRQYYSQPPQNYQPQYTRPQPVATAPVNPVRNVVRPVAKQPKKNDSFGLHDQDMTAMSAEFDARQSNEASKAGGKIDAAIEDEVSDKEGAGTAPPGMNQAWAEAVTSGDPEKYQEFKDRFGGDLSPEAQKQLDTRIAILEYEQDLAAGVLTDAGKDQAIQEINDQIAGWGPSPLKDGVQDNLAEMDKFNELGKLSTLAQDSDNPWDVMWEGTQNAGYPVTFLAEVSGLPIMADPITDSTASGSATTVIMNPQETGQTVNYNLGSYPYSIGPGQSQRLEKSYVISFDPGNGGAVKKYTLGTGTYKFVLRDGGWDLQTVKIAVTIDNSQYDGTFNYLVDGKEAVLRPGEAADLTSQLPIVVEFDRGDGGKAARKVLTEGTYVVGVDASQQRLDLFDADVQGASALIASSGSDSSSTAISTTNKPKSKRGDKAKLIQEALARLKAKG